MKLKNNQVKDNILSSALMEFYNYGYNEASIREIAKSANITPGNIYRYFASKEELFEAIVGDVNKSILKIISLDGLALPKLITESQKVIQFVVHKAISLIVKNKYQIVILIKKASGSKYESTYGTIIEYTTESIDQTSSKPNYDLSRIIAKALIDGIITIIVENIDDEEKMAELIIEFVGVLFLKTMAK